MSLLKCQFLYTKYGEVKDSGFWGKVRFGGDGSGDDSGQHCQSKDSKEAHSEMMFAVCEVLFSNNESKSSQLCLESSSEGLYRET
jgi:hypothetical protein